MPDLNDTIRTLEWILADAEANEHSTGMYIPGIRNALTLLRERTAYWLECDSGFKGHPNYQCSAWGIDWAFMAAAKDIKYCPNCGAKMEGVLHDDCGEEGDCGEA